MTTRKKSRRSTVGASGTGGIDAATRAKAEAYMDDVLQEQLANAAREVVQRLMVGYPGDDGGLGWKAMGYTEEQVAALHARTCAAIDTLLAQEMTNDR